MENRHQGTDQSRRSDDITAPLRRLLVWDPSKTAQFDLFELVINAVGGKQTRAKTRILI